MSKGERTHGGSKDPISQKKKDFLAAQRVYKRDLDAFLTAPLLARFLDTELGDLLPILEGLPESRRRAIRILVTSEQGALRQEALHCLERWPDPELCSAASAEMPETSLARELLPLAFSTDRSLATSVARVLERARRHEDALDAPLRVRRHLHDPGDRVRAQRPR